jgi:uncharacterized protein YeaO (DUF488 family)
VNVMLKRAYASPAKDDGQRILVDRLWPRGVAKVKAKIDLWLKEVAPSTELRQWFGHDPEKWSEFKKRYRAELKNNPAWSELQSLSRQGDLTLVYAAKGSTPKSRTVVKGLRTSGLALRLFFASSGCGTARCIRTHRPLRHRASDTSCGRSARA